METVDFGYQNLLKPVHAIALRCFRFGAKLKFRISVAIKNSDQ
jgi:hypothetical protein